MVEKLLKSAEAKYPGPRYAVVSNEKAPGLNRKPDVTVIDRQTRKVVKVYEAARFDKAGKLIRPDERAKILEYKSAGIPYEFHPVGPNAPPGGILEE